MPESIDASLVRIHTKDGYVVGAGFLVGERHVLTCAHVITQALGLASNVSAPQSSTVNLDFPRLAAHTLLTANVVFWCPVQADGRGDIAGLELLDKPPLGAEAVHFAPTEQVWGHSYRALGFPSGQDDGVWSDGRLLGRQGINWLQLEDDKMPGFAIMSGFSGAPVWDEQLQGVVGMIVAASQPSTTKTGFAIPPDVLIASWPQLASLMLPPVPRNPYKGLHAFTEQDKHDFFGREALVDELVTGVATSLAHEQKEGQMARLLAVVLGPSGSGKSSVVMAGLLPRLRGGGVLNSKEWVYLDPIFPGAHPLEALAVSLAKQWPARSVVSLHDDLTSASARSLHLLVSQLATSLQQRAVLIVDQFEEMFTLTTDEAERQHFFDLLVTAVTESRGPLLVILTLRADFYDRPMHYPELYRLIDGHHISVLPMQRDELRKVIEEPANLPDVQLTFESGLVDELLFEMQGQSGALPLLQFTLDQLFERRKGHMLTLQAYTDIGGVKGALTKQAEDTYMALPSDEHRQMAREVFLRVVEPGTTEQDTTRRRAAHAEFERADPTQTKQIQETLEAFITARLVTTNQINGKTTIEVSHEALIREWKRLADWLHEARGDILFQRSLSEDVTEWEQRKRPSDRLYRGTQLKEARTWAKHNKPSEQEMSFLQASMFQRTLSIARFALVLCLLVLSGGGLAWYAAHLPPTPTLVTNLEDEGTGSLRWCIASANPGSTIKFATNVQGTIKLVSGSVSIDKNLAIQGPDTRLLTVSSAGPSIQVSAHASVTISNLSFKNGTFTNTGFIVNEGNLTVTNSIFSNNQAQRNLTTTHYGSSLTNSNSGNLIVSNSTFSNNSSQLGSGAIESQSIGSLIVSNSTFSNNSAEVAGGAINSFGSLTVSNSTFYNNRAGTGGAIETYGRLIMSNSTFFNNSSLDPTGFLGGGGAIHIADMDRFQGDDLLIFCTVYENQVSASKPGEYTHPSSGGGISIDQYATDDGRVQLILMNSIVADNQATKGLDIAGPLITGGHNLIQNFAGATFLDSYKLHVTDKEVKQISDLKIDPTPGSNGGLTQTLTLQLGSPAIDAIPSQLCNLTINDFANHKVTLTSDQRGKHRPDGTEDACDIGAYESSY